MRLKKIRLAGFKSFVDPTTIPFPSDMTAIVGPNGCGKSNVIDAVRWVLGESSAKNLRGDAMTDVIFNGSSARKPVGQSSVELVFDNSSGRISGEYATFNELSIKRIVTREAVSTYFLNGSKCRRRDVTDLFLGTGLGPRSYAIIEQGMISRLIESKPQELRVFIEEAAGISKYKERRRETENRIRHTVDNLERLEDIRAEMGRQLEKLQRQAAAAKRYTSLKSLERKLKGELAAIKWLKHDHHLKQLEMQQLELQTDIENLRAKQRGDEAGIERYRDEQLNCKEQLEELQQQLFSLSATISRIEQSALHNQQRRQQVEKELADISAQVSQLREESSELEQLAEQLTVSLEDLAPEYELKQEICEQLQASRDDAEHNLAQHQRDYQHNDQQFHQLKQQVHTHHSKIQALLQMQLRTQQRISDIDQELNEFASEDSQGTIEKLQINMDDFAKQRTVLEEKISELSARQDVRDNERKALEASNAQVNTALAKCESQRAALETLQSAASTSSKAPEFVEPLWKRLTPKEGAAPIIEQVLCFLGEAYASGYTLDALLAHEHQLTEGLRYFSEAQFTKHKEPGTVADLLVNKQVPECFNTIFVATDINDANRLRANNAKAELIATKDGKWLACDWFSFGQKDEQAGVLQRAQQIENIAIQIVELTNQRNTLQLNIDELTQLFNDAQQQLLALKSQLQDINTQQQQCQGKISWLSEQQQRQASKHTRLIDERERQQFQLEEEAGDLAILNETVEELELQLADQQDSQLELQQRQQSLQQQLTAHRNQLEANTRQLHELALRQQESKNRLESIGSQSKRIEQQTETLLNKQLILNEEYQALAQPAEDQRAQLHGLLDEKLTLEERKREVQLQLEVAESQLTQAMNGQQGYLTEIAKQQSRLDSLKIESEGDRVRGLAILDQLSELNITLKEVLETLPSEANESQWQQELLKTTSAIQRLGAVNLAAVEEYDVQAERKSHLDTQYDDLTDALETLQSAIRKIDKETKTRFSTTFEKVNSDLGLLFPKVFGGGSAYLALTDDDLLETGVSIMARPPGKKNSTIHLLSGGEKALTALSLVFAIFRLNPAPFCLLDEVDAPLDDANVGRFCNLVSEMSNSVQFIYISHNKIAMEMASHLTGVTMAEPGVSRMVAVDVDEAVSLVES